jgi:excisionase family DNA binding protein
VMIEDPVINGARAPMPIAVRVREACRLTGIGRSKLYELIAARQIDVVKVGAITLIPVSSLVHFIEVLQRAER